MQRFIINILLILCPLMAKAQLFKDIEEGRDKALRVSIDPTVSLKTYLQDASISGFEATVDTEVKQNLFAVAATGFYNVSYSNDVNEYTMNGSFISLGADLNLTQHASLSDRDIFFMGFHYGFSTYSHEASRIFIPNPLGDFTTSVPSEMMHAGWVELAMGLKTEFAKNLFFGWTAEAKLLTHCSSGVLEPYYIPGFGKNDDDSFAFDFNIFLSYAFTFKAKSKPQLEEVK